MARLLSGLGRSRVPLRAGRSSAGGVAASGGCRVAPWSPEPVLNRALGRQSRVDEGLYRLLETSIRLLAEGRGVGTVPGQEVESSGLGQLATSGEKVCLDKPGVVTFPVRKADHRPGILEGLLCEIGSACASVKESEGEASAASRRRAS